MSTKKTTRKTARRSKEADKTELSKMQRVRRAIKDKSLTTLFEAVMDPQFCKQNAGDYWHCEPSIRPSLRMKMRKRKNIAVGSSKFGGLPDVPADFRWPEPVKKTPFTFLCQLNLSDVHLDFNLPASGMLYFFMQIGHRDGSPQPPWKWTGLTWEVLFVETNDITQLKRSTHEGVALPERKIEFQPEDTIGDSSDIEVFEQPVSYFDGSLLDRALDRIYRKGPMHRVGWYPQCKYESVELMLTPFWDEVGSDDRGPNADDYFDAQKWRLLLQLDADEELGMGWKYGDRLYFLISEEDLANRCFEYTELIMQF